MHKIIKSKVTKNKTKDTYITPTYASRMMEQSIPKFTLPETGLPSNVAYNLVHDQLALDGNARLNLATYVTTWMEPEVKRLMGETFDKNMIDKDEYPATAEIESRCVNILGNLFHAEKAEHAAGTSTVGSSEAAMLCGLALKFQWRKLRQTQNKTTDKPNLVMGSHVQVCWDKFCRYFDVTPRFVKCQGNNFNLSVSEALELCDENTIGIVAILGSTFDGSYDPINELNHELNKFNQENDMQIPIHVDAASGGFIAPFLQPGLAWDFRLKWVKSINVSGHKYGLVYPGVGFAIWRNWHEIPEELIFHVKYLGGDMPTFALNFSRPGNQVVAQYYNFLRLGFAGYQKIQQNCQHVANYFAESIEKIGLFKILSRGDDIPVVCWTFNQPQHFTLFDFSERLRDRGWLIPAYPMPEDRQDLIVMRIVVKEGFSRDMADQLLTDMKRHLQFFTENLDYQSNSDESCFHH